MKRELLSQKSTESENSKALEFLRAVSQAKTAVMQGAEPAWIEASADVLEQFIPGGIKPGTYVWYENCRVCNEGDSEKIQAEENVPYAHRVLNETYTLKGRDVV